MGLSWVGKCCVGWGGFSDGDEDGIEEEIRYTRHVNTHVQ